MRKAASNVGMAITGKRKPRRGGDWECCREIWWREPDSNRRPSSYEHDELPTALSRSNEKARSMAGFLRRQGSCGVGYFLHGRCQVFQSSNRNEIGRAHV